MNNFKSAIIIISVTAFLIAGTFCYVNYLINKPLDIELPKEFTYNNTKIALTWTDDNTGEDLIIQSDRKEYSGFNSVDVYFSITNITKKYQDMDVVAWVGNEGVEVENMERLETEPESAPKALSVRRTDSALGADSNRKNINDFTTGYSANDKIESGETNYYKATIKYPPMSEGEFFIEAFGRDKDTECPIGHSVSCGFFAYGHLDPWYSSSWSYRKRIDIEADQIATTTSNFPILATTTDSDLAFTGHSGKVASSTGADIVFADAAGNLLNYEREKYASTTGEIVYWIKTDISSTTDAVLYMYYGNSGMAADLATTTGVWDDNYIAVYHMDDLATSTIFDSITGNNGIKASANNPIEADERIAKGQDFSLDYITATSTGFSPTADFTLSAWVNADTLAADSYAIFSQQDGGGLGRSLMLVNASSYPNSFLGGSNSQALTTISAGTYYLITVTYDHFATTVTVHINDDGGNATTETGETASGNIVIGSHKSTTSNHWDGGIDEARISNVVRTIGWISTEYNNQSDVSSFLTFGAEEDNTPTEFISTIMQTGGDYGGLSVWEDAVECDLTATSTRVFSGTGTGNLSEDNIVTLYRSGVSLLATSTVVATTSDQILVDGIYGVSYDLVAQSGDIWRKDANNYWTISGTTGNELGDTAIAIAKIDGAWSSADETAVTIDGWTTSADNYIKIYTTESARHDGVWDDGKYRLEAPNTNASLYIQEHYVRLEGLQVENTNTGHSIYAYLPDNPGVIKISHNIVKSRGIKVEASGWADQNKFKIWNNIVYNSPSCILVNYTHRTAVYNNTVYNCSNAGIVGYSSGYLKVKNNIVQNCTNGFNHSSSFDSSSDYNISDILGDAPNATFSTSSINVIFADETNDNFHLSPSDTSAKDAGVNLHNDSNLSFSDDIDGEDRPPSNWDIGADEIETPVEFVATITQSGGEYSSLHAWEDAIECDLTASTTRVYNYTGSGYIQDGTEVSTDSNTSTSTLIHQASSSQVLLINITGSFDNGDVITDGTNSITLSNAGASPIAIAKIDGAWSSADTAAVAIDGWTTSAVNYIKIYTTTAARHNGTAGTGYRVNPSADGHAFTIGDDNVIIEGIEVTGVSGSSNEAFRVKNTNITISHCLIHDLENGSEMSDGVFINTNNITVYVYNCIFYNIDRSAVNIQNAQNANVYVYNCTAYNVGTNEAGGTYAVFGFDIHAERNNSGTTMYAKNNIAHAGSAIVDCYREGGGAGAGYYSATSDYNIASDTTTTGGSNDISSTIPAFVNIASGSENFHLASSDIAAKNSGANLSSDSALGFQDDIDGTNRDANWDIGADETRDVWYNVNYQCRRTVTLQSSKIATTTSGFPVLATTTDANLKTSANGGRVQSSSGHDIVFINSDGSTLLNYEREKYASTTGEIVYWIKTDISSTIDKTIYMYYGNSSASDLATTTGVWDDNFVMVQHLQEDPGPGGTGDIKDSTKNANNGTATTSMTTSDQVTGQVYGSLDFDGTDDYVSGSISEPANCVGTVSLWAYPHTEGENNESRFFMLQPASGWNSLFFYGSGINQLEYALADGTNTLERRGTNNDISLNAWNHIAVTYNGGGATGMKIYVDGSEVTYTSTVGTETMTATPADFVIGSNEIGIGDYDFDGIIDEFHVSNTVRSSGWISTEYNNQSNVSSFITYGAEECLSVPIERSGGENVKTRIKGGTIFKGGVRF